MRFSDEKEVREINQFENCLFAKMIDTNEKNLISIHLQIKRTIKQMMRNKEKKERKKKNENVVFFFCVLFPYCGDERSSNDEHNQ